MLAYGTDIRYHSCMKRRNQRALELLFHRPTSGNVSFDSVLALFRELGAEFEHDRAGSRVAIILFGEVKVLHRPHPRPHMDKGAVASVRDWLKLHGVEP